MRLDEAEQVQHHYDQDDYHHYGDDASAPHLLCRPPRAFVFELESLGSQRRRERSSSATITRMITTRMYTRLPDLTSILPLLIAN